jgi:hypothetical protein
MKQMLVSLDVLDDPTATAEARAAAAAVVVDCHARALQSCSPLRRQLAYAEEFRDLLAARGRRD